MKRWILSILIGIVVLVLLGGLAFYTSLTGFSFFEQKKDTPWQPISITQDNVATVFSQMNVVRDLPAEGSVAVYIGNVGYALAREGMTRGAPTNPDMTLRIPESYLALMGQRGPCAALSQARASGDLGVELHEDTSSLAWKYRALVKYKSCLGGR